ncbi:MAG: hypothetical protein Q8922_04515 [Bacteroidota bacterium]|nr:hypothetical protein [Bacteroidota bacterium]MDP4231844.1 hypothetical protein [Bacteroidota bacterium]MDP4242730.1 hypothetical protein [Bacteroidota bacterium]MDP4287181.1 hypothetical protein [Bacteroidota bacterium]
MRTRLEGTLARSDFSASESEIEDAMQHAFEKIIPVIKEIRDQDRWLFVVATRYMKRERHRAERCKPLDATVAEEEEAELTICNDELAAALRTMFPSDEAYAVIRYLYDHDPEAFATAIYHFERGRTFDSLAEALRNDGKSVTANAIQKRLHKALRNASKAVGITHPRKSRRKDDPK